MNNTKGFLAQRLIAKRYEDRGYAVTLEPPSAAIPFSIGKYNPDILATKGDEHIIIEVKTAGARVDPEAYVRLGEEIHQHPGWQFLLVTVAESELEDVDLSVSGNVDLESIRGRLRAVERLIGDPEMAIITLPVLWTVYISAIKILLVDEGANIDGYSDYSLINKAYSDGIVSFDEYEAARRLMDLRNRAVHSLEIVVNSADSEQLWKMIQDLLTRISSSRPSSVSH